MNVSHARRRKERREQGKHKQEWTETVTDFDRK